ncbi:hypothetical protein CRM22_002733, partial [Opisthorchis felineus]
RVAPQLVFEPASPEQLSTFQPQVYPQALSDQQPGENCVTLRELRTQRSQIPDLFVMLLMQSEYDIEYLMIRGTTTAFISKLGVVINAVTSGVAIVVCYLFILLDAKWDSHQSSGIDLRNYLHWLDLFMTIQWKFSYPNDGQIVRICVFDLQIKKPARRRRGSKE